MRYCVIQITKGASFSINTEWTDLEKAKGAYNSLCATLHNDKGEFHVTVALVDENLDIVEGKYKDVIVHEAVEE